MVPPYIIGRNHDSQTEDIDLGLGLDKRLPLLIRSRLLVGPRNYANLKAIISPVDKFVDLNVTRKEIEDKQGDIKKLRPSGTNGLLLVYPISKNSAPKNTAASNGRDPKRGPLDAVENLIGVGIVFPDAKNSTPQSYKTVDLSRLVREKPDWPEEEEENQ